MAGAADDGTALASAATRDGVKIILLGDSAVGKSKLVERFLMDG
jgi:GTPase SAR1 family protein